MLDIKFLTENSHELKINLEKRGNHYSGIIDELVKIHQKRKELMQKIQNLREERNLKSKEIGVMKQNGKDISEISLVVKKINTETKELEDLHEEEERKLNDLNLSLPNFLDEKVPIGKNETENKELYIVGKKREFPFQPKTHFELGEKLGWIDFERGVKLSGARFYTYFNQGAKLERALMNYMLDVHTSKNGYTEVWVPMVVTDECMMTTGQYPKFKEEYYRMEKDGLNLIPTAEVPLTNLYRDEILSEDSLPISVTAHTSCFRREAGSYGKDTRGLVRVHQFQKIELVKFTKPEDSEKEHLKMLDNVESILKDLGLSYRVVLLCSGDISASSSITYDIELWMPGLNRYMEVSSVSNFKDFQSRRGKIRYKSKEGKNVLVHTINGSGLAIGRTFAAILENYQDEKGNIQFPEILKKYIS